MFGKGTEKSTGVAEINFPFNNLIMSLKISNVESDIPIILSLSDMDRLGVYYDNKLDKLVYRTSGTSIDVTREYGNAFVTWNPMTECYLTYQELSRLHRRFSHPSSEKLMDVLRRADGKNVGDNNRKMLEQIGRTCSSCQKYAQQPKRFIFELRDEKYFNQNIFVDKFTLERKPVLHVVDESTRYHACR